MVQLFFELPHSRRCMDPGLPLFGVWFAGLSLGLWAACFYGDPIGALALAAGASELTFRAACVVTVLPLFLSAFAVFVFHRAGVYLVCTLRGLVLGFFLGILMDAGGIWLAALLLFSAHGVSVVLLWFFQRALVQDRERLLSDVLSCLAAVLAVSAVDTWAVAPFLAAALSY